MASNLKNEDMGRGTEKGTWHGRVSEREKGPKNEVGVDSNFFVQLDRLHGIKANGARIRVYKCLDGSKFEE